MEVPGGLPPDRDTYSCHQPSNLNTSSGQHNISSSSSVGVSSSSQLQSQQYHQLAQQLQPQQQHQLHQQQQQQQLERLSRPMSFDKMEQLVREMQDAEMGVPVRSQKLFLTSIPSAFMGYDLIEWMMERLNIEESEALNIANQLCLHGYFFPVNDSKTLVVKDDSSLYRFQTPYYWPWQHKAPDNVEYAIYLAKRSLRNKQRHGLEEYESEALANLHKNLKAKWDFITMQAEEQVKLAKDRKKGDKIVGDSQERAYWRVHRPPPVQFTPLEPCPVPSRDRHGKPRRRTIDDLQREVDYLKGSMGRTRMKMSQACECLIQYCETFAEYDFFFQPVLPSNPWVSEDTTFWQLNSSIVDIPTEKRVKRWSISIEELVSDPTGLQEFTAYLKKEYSHENIRFWIAVNDLRRSAHSQIFRKVKDIYEEFLEPGAPCEINIDSQTMEKVQHNLKNPSRYTFDAAADHIYTLLLKKDCYPRFVRSDHYKSLLATGIQPAHKKRFFGFGVPKKKSSTAPPIPSLLTQVPGPSIVPPPGNLIRRRGSDRSLSGSAHELAVSGVKDGANKVPHSHSQSNLSDIPYSVVIYRGDMPSAGLTTHIEDLSSTSLSSSIVVPLKAADAQDAKTKNQDGSKTVGDTLEPTQESSACAVCPWETAEPVETAISVSISPWDNDEQAPVSHTANRTRNNSAIESGSSSSDISEMSDRMRRSCGLRQNTLDCDLYSSKRLAPAATEQRRASMTIAPRMSDLQFSLRQQTAQSPTASATAATTPIHPSTSAIVVVSERPHLSQLSLNQLTTMSFEDREELHMLPATITEEVSEKCPQEQLHTLNISDNADDDNDNNNSKTLKNYANEINLVKTNESDSLTMPATSTGDPELNQPEPSTAAAASTSTDLVIPAVTITSAATPTNVISTVNTITTITTITTISATNTISTCTTSNVTTTTDATNAATSKTDDTIDPNTLISLETQPFITTPPIITVIGVIGDDPSSSSKCSADNITVDSERQRSRSPSPTIVDSSPVAPPSSLISSTTPTPTPAGNTTGSIGATTITMDVQCFDDKYIISQEELSPTTEEYQECCPPDDYQYDLSSEGEILVSGCVAPAPTPAPSIAPLAEVEIDPPDDETECIEPTSIAPPSAAPIVTPIVALPSPSSAFASVSTLASTQAATDVDVEHIEHVEHVEHVEHKKKRKKRDSETKAKDDQSSVPMPLSTQLPSVSGDTDSQVRNAVCPWEDDDVSSSTDAPFVKTYATLGYL